MSVAFRATTRRSITSETRVSGEQEDLADRDLADQPPALVDDVDDRERLAVVPVPADVVEDVGHGPSRAARGRSPGVMSRPMLPSG